MSVSRLEDLVVWVRSRNLNKMAYQVVRTIPDPDYRSQMKRSALSIPSNIGEGFGRRSNATFILFLGYAQGSAYELKTQLLASVDVELINEERVVPVLNELDEVSAMIHGLILHLQKKGR
jgi:four helix bundle protein